MAGAFARNIALILLATAFAPRMASAGSAHIGHPHAEQTQPHWGTHEGHVKFYEKMIAKYDEHPGKFTERHHLMSKAIRDPEFNQAMIHRLLNHPARFILNHPCFSRFLDGEIHVPPVLGNTGPVVASTTTEIAAEGSKSGGGGTDLPKPGPTPSGAVPEPSSILLMATAIISSAAVRLRKVRLNGSL